MQERNEKILLVSLLIATLLTIAFSVMIEYVKEADIVMSLALDMMLLSAAIYLIALILSYSDRPDFLLAGSIFPLSSEVVMLALMAAGLAPWQLVVYGTIGNTLGSMFNYWIGTLGRMDWIEKYLHVKKKDLDRAQRFMAGRGALMGFFAFLPAIGEGITIVLGLMHANVALTVVSVTIGKLTRYALLALGVEIFV